MKNILQIGIILLLIFKPIFSQSDFAYTQALQFYEDEQYAAARDLFLEVTQKDDTDQNLVATSKYYSAKCLVQLNLIDGAIEELEFFIRKYKFSAYLPDAIYTLGTIYFAKHQYFKAREKLLRLVNEYPKNEYSSIAYYWIGQSYVNENKFIEGEEFLLEAISDDRNADKIDYTIYSLAYIYELKENYNSAVTYYDELLAYHRESELAPNAQLRIGACYFSLKEYDRTILELTDPLINKLPEDQQVEAGYLLANAHFRLQEYEQAEEAFKDVLSRTTSSNVERQSRFGIAWVNFQQQNYETAYDQFSDLIIKDSADSITVKSIYWSAECKRYLGQIDSATVIYNQFLSEYPNDDMADAVKLSLSILQFNSKETKISERNLIVASQSKDKIIKGRSLTLLGEINLKDKNYSQAEKYFKRTLKITLLPKKMSNRAILGLGVSQFYSKKYDDALTNLNDLNVSAQRFETRKVNFYLGETYFERGNYVAAQRHYYRVEHLGDDLDRFSLYGSAYSYFNMKDFANAAYYFNEYLTKYPKDKNAKDSRLRLADCYFGMKNFEKATAEYRKIFNSYGVNYRNDYTLYQFGQSLFKSGESNEAIQKMQQLQNEYPKSRYKDDAQYLIGWINFQRGDFQTAQNNYKKLLTLYPKSSIKPIAIYSIGDSYYNMGEYDSSIAYYLKIIADYPKTRYVYDAMNGIQYSYLAKDEPENAVTLINAYIVKYPHTENSAKILMKKGEIYYSYGNYEKAIDGYNEMINFYPKSNLTPTAMYWVGKSYTMIEDTSNSIVYFSKVVEKHLRSEYGIEAVIELGKIYSEQENFAQEIQLYAGVLPKISKLDRAQEILFLKGVAELNSGDLNSGYNSFSEIIKYYDKTLFSAKSKIELGKMELNEKRYSNSELLFGEVAQNRSDDIGAEAQYYLGFVLYEQGSYEEAISALVRVRTVYASYDEWFIKSLLKLGDCYIKIDDKKNAREMYRAVAKRHPDDEYGKEAKEKLNEL
ncbi:MAG: tetratricopeptide repeat protein [Bacteroidota bacterium]